MAASVRPPAGEVHRAGRHLHLDCSSGVAGDMLLAALIDAGAGAAADRADRDRVGEPSSCLAQVQEALDSLPLPGGRSVRLDFQEVTRHGLRGLLLRVEEGDLRVAETGGELLNIVESSPMDEGARAIALRALSALIEAENAAHGAGQRGAAGQRARHGARQSARHHPHLHEIGCLDTLLDIVGVAAAVSALGISTVTCSPIAVGSGRMKTSHGSLAVPAPATAHLLKGLTVEAGPSPVPGDGGADTGIELTTPTGAALLRALAARPSEMPRMELGAVGSGAGSRELNHPNLLRAFIGAGVAITSQAPVETAMATRELILLEAGIDDARPDRLAHLTSRLLEESARDAWVTPVTMKKGRPGHLLSILCDAAASRPLSLLVLKEGVTLGIREQRLLRHELERRVIDTLVEGHNVRVKIGILGSLAVRVRAEHDDVAAAAAAGAGSMEDISQTAESQARAALAER